jgi:hypothetical protein
MFNKSLIIAINIFICSLFSYASFAESSDATSVKPVLASTASPSVVYTDDCEDAPNIKAVIIGGSGGTLGEKESSCKRGYVPKAFKVYVGVGFGTQFGEMNWRYKCCKTKVTYQ